MADTSTQYAPHEILQPTDKNFLQVAKFLIQASAGEEDPLPIEVKNLPYYHGYLPRNDAANLVLKIGDFLLRRIDIESIHSIRKDWAILMTIRTRLGYPSAAVEHVNVAMSISIANTNDQCEKLIKEIDLAMRTRQTKIFPYLPCRPINRQKWLFSHRDIRFEERVGNGSFGEVWKGYLFLKHNRILQCAIKRHCDLRPTTEERCREFLVEARVNLNLDHPNVVKFRGLAYDREPILLLLEWCDHGSLLQCLTKFNQTILLSRRMRWIHEAAEGLQYLASKGIIHRDFASRNCLLDHNYQIKVSDFGKSVFSAKHTSPTRNFLNQQCAPETLRQLEFTTKTDVWAYGLFLYEVFTGGYTPHLRESHVQRKNETYIISVKYIFPPNMPKIVTHVVSSCFSIDPNKRCSFDDLVELFENSRDFAIDQTEKHDEVPMEID